jgi:hypothetical protein
MDAWGEGSLAAPSFVSINTRTLERGGPGLELYEAVGSPVRAIREMRARPASASAAGRQRGSDGLPGGRADLHATTATVTPARASRVPHAATASHHSLVGGTAWWDKVHRKVERAARRKAREEDRRAREEAAAAAARAAAQAAARYSARCSEQVLDARNLLTLWWLKVWVNR